LSVWNEKDSKWETGYQVGLAIKERGLEVRKKKSWRNANQCGGGPGAGFNEATSRRTGGRGELAEVFENWEGLGILVLSSKKSQGREQDKVLKRKFFCIITQCKGDSRRGKGGSRRE